MKRLLLVSLPLFVLALTGCNTDSTELPVDGRDFDGVGYNEPGGYNGVVMAGYLRNARVWLDLDGDGQYTQGPVTVTLASGTKVVIEGGEPTAMSGPGGAFTLDTTDLVRDPLKAPDLDPRDYPLMALAIPGTTREETAHGEVAISSAYLLAAPAGVRNVTPLTSLLFSRQLGGVSAEPGDSGVLTDAFRQTNLNGDYIKAGNVQAQVYAAAMARFLASQFPTNYSTALQGSNGTRRGLTLNGSNLLWVSFAHAAADIVQAVDDAAPSGRYGNVNVAELDLPVVELDLKNPYILRSQRVSAQTKSGRDLPMRASAMSDSAELTFEYDGQGRVSAISASGCMSPSMHEIARLADAGGYIADTGIQWLPGVSLSRDSGDYYAEDRVDERLVFDWENKTATFDTTTTCEPGLASGTELGGPPARSYSWTQVDNTVDSITDSSTTIVYTGDRVSAAYDGYTQTVDGAEQESVTLAETRQSCEADIAPEDLAANRVVSARQNYTFTGYEPQPEGFVDLMLELDDRNGTDRLLSYSFLDPALAALDHMTSAAEGFTWEFHYPHADAVPAPDQPNLIHEAILMPFRGPTECGTRLSAEDTDPRFARVMYRYSRLSEYLAEELN